MPLDEKAQQKVIQAAKNQAARQAGAGPGDGEFKNHILFFSVNSALLGTKHYLFHFYEFL